MRDRGSATGMPKRVGCGVRRLPIALWLFMGLLAALGVALSACATPQARPHAFAAPGEGEDLLSVGSAYELEGVLAGHPLVFVDFYMDDCGPCKMMAPRLRDLARRYRGKVVFVAVNVSQVQALGTVYGVRMAPDMRLFKENIQVGQWEGYQREDVLADAIDAALRSQAGVARRAGGK